MKTGIEELLKNYQSEIFDIYKKNDLTSIRGLNLEYTLFGRELLPWYYDTLREISIKNSKFNERQNKDDILFISDEILYFTAHVFMYRPFLNSPIDDRYNLNGKTIYPNFQNMYSKRYNMFSDVVFQQFFNYWDRIGAIIAAFYSREFKKKNIHFTSAIDTIDAKFHHLKSYHWLKNFRENDFRKLNASRKSIVHKTSLDTQAKNELLEINSEKEAVEKWVEKQDSFSEYFKTEINNTLLGLKYTLELAEEMTKEYCKEES